MTTSTTTGRLFLGPPAPLPPPTPSDARLVDTALDLLTRSAMGSALADRLRACGARIQVITDEAFAAIGHDRAHAFFDPLQGTMVLRRSDLVDPARRAFAAVALAHEGTHLLDHAGRVAEPFLHAAATRVAAAGGPETPAGGLLQQQAAFECLMVKETRAFVCAGQVARDLGVQLPDHDPTAVAAAGANDAATYVRVWQALLQSSYNPEGRTAPPRTF